jgi:hypothetical protein
MQNRFIKLLPLAVLLPIIALVPALGQQPAAPVPADPVDQQGVEVQARGPIHEAFATPTSDPVETPLQSKKPPAPIEEMPPAEKPAGDVVWIGGYWHWDDDRQDYLWVSGCWRTLPRGRQWVAGYWREQNDQWQWVPGFWAAAEQHTGKTAEVTYMPTPPAAPQVAPPGPAPNADSFYVPGNWVWREGEGRFVWVAGYWARVQPDYVWVPGHYRWTPYGYVYIPGYWDYTLAHRGILYTPVVIDTAVVGPGFVYIPAYAVTDVVIVDTLWIRPGCCHYYYGDYYGPVYHRWGFECCVVYSDRHYDSIIVYHAWEHRGEPRWRERQINIYVERDAGRAPLPPRTLAQQRVNVNVNVTMVAPAARVAAAHGVQTVPVSVEARVQAKNQAQIAHAAAVQQRMQVEAKASGPPTAPRTAPLPPASHSHAAAPAVGGAGTSGAQVSPGNKGAVIPGKTATGGPTMPSSPGAHGATIPAHGPGQGPPGQGQRGPGQPNQQHPPAAGQQQQQHPPQQQQQSQQQQQQKQQSPQ